MHGSTVPFRLTGSLKRSKNRGEKDGVTYGRWELRKSQMISSRRYSECKGGGVKKEKKTK